MTPNDILDEMQIGFTKGRGARGEPRRYVAGLLVAFCDFLSELAFTQRRFSRWPIFLCVTRRSRKASAR
jgi:hypothetical protein